MCDVTQSIKFVITCIQNGCNIPYQLYLFDPIVLFRIFTRMNHAAPLYEDSESSSDSEDENVTHPSNLDTSSRFTIKDSVDNILSLTAAHNTWIQEICILEDTASQNKVDLSPAISKQPPPQTPETASNQPSQYPRYCHYRFPTRFRGHEAWPDLMELIVSQNTCPGCSLVSNGGGSADQHTYQLYCPHYLVMDNNSNHYTDGKLAMDDIKRETVVRVKTKGDKTPGILAMHNKTDRGEIPPIEKSIDLDAPSLNKRTVSRRASSKEKRCRMHLVINRSMLDDYFYLSSYSTIEHSGHPFIPPSALSSSKKDLDSFESKLVQLLYDERVSPTQIARFLNSLKGDDKTCFLPKTIYNMNNKTQKLLSLSQGITSVMSDADVTLKKLEA